MNILYLLLLLILLTSYPVSSSTFFCSTYCAANQCTGIAANTCTNCASNWVTSGSTCAPNTGYTLIDTTNDLLGTMVFNPFSTTTVNGYTYIGNISSTTSITITSTAGISQPHFSL